MTESDLLINLLRACQPGSLLVCGADAAKAARHWEDKSDCVIEELDASSPNEEFPLSRLFDLAVISNTLEHLSREEGELLLGQLRNAGSRQIGVLSTEADHWHFNDFIALGFKRQEVLEGPPKRTLYTYDIATYNPKREWNTPKNWANPEMWDKARW